jgi:hypothetical protein
MTTYPLRSQSLRSLAIVLAVAAAFYAPSMAAAQVPARPRVLVLTDISNEPDDEESLVRFLVSSNEFDVEGLIATTSTWLKEGPREDLIRRQVQAYGQVHNRLSIHAAGYPDVSALLDACHTGQPTYGMAAVGAGKSTPGSDHLIGAVDRNDDRPLWVTIWGGANTLAQALHDVRATRKEAEVDAFVSRIRAYAISDQDDAGRWIRDQFPKLFYIVSPSMQRSEEYYRATWTGISGDRYYKNGPGEFQSLVENPWLEANIIKNHGPLGALYPPFAYIMEGDTPSYIGLINNGLGWHVSPSYGGWGGRYGLYQASGESRPIWTDYNETRDTVTLQNGSKHTSHQASIWRWRQAYQHDFAARMDWCIADQYTNANHHPIAIVDNDRSKDIIQRTANSGETVCLSSAGCSDPDGNGLDRSWMVYREAGTYPGEIALRVEGDSVQFIAPQVGDQATIHLILTVRDNGTPSLTSYRRVIISINAAPSN